MMNSAPIITSNIQSTGIQQPSPTVPNTANKANSNNLKSKMDFYLKMFIYLILIILAIASIYIILYFTILPKNEIKISNQILGNTIHIDKLRITERSLLIITTKNKVGKPDTQNTVAYSEPLVPDIYTDFDLDISPLETDSNTNNIDSTSFFKRKTEIKSGDTLFALINKLPDYNDNIKEKVKRQLESAKDIDYWYAKDIFGKPISVKFIVK